METLVYEYWLDADRFWAWRLRTDSGLLLATGEKYRREANCLHAIRLIRASSMARMHRLPHQPANGVAQAVEAQQETGPDGA